MGMNPALTLMAAGSAAAASCEYLGRYYFTGGGPTHSFANVGLGDDSVARTIILVITRRVSQGNALSSVTVAGNAATIDVNGGFAYTAAIARIDLAAGTPTGTVVCTYGASGNDWVSLIYVYEATDGVTPVDTALDYVSGGTGEATSTGTVDTVSGGFVVAGACVSSDRTWSWANISEDNEYQSANPSSAAAHALTTGAAVTVEASPSSTGGWYQTLAVASYGL